MRWLVTQLAMTRNSPAELFRRLLGLMPCGGDLRSQRFHLCFEQSDPAAIRFDRLEQAIECRVEVMIPRISERAGKLCGRVTNKLQIPFVGEHSRGVRDRV